MTAGAASAHAAAMVRRLFVVALAGLAFTGCGGGGGSGDDDAGGDGPAIDAPDVQPDGPVDAPTDAPSGIPKLRNPVATPDLELAQQATAILGVGGAKNCDRCHALTRDRLNSWRNETNSAVVSCLSDVEPDTQAEALAIIDCFRATPGQITSGWPPHKLGIYNTAARLAWFEYVFELAYGASFQTELDLFVGEAAMPRGDTGWFTQGDFDIVAEWFSRGLPQLDAVVEGDPPVTQCTTAITSEVATHAATMATQGWRAVNEENGILMFGCAGAATERDCLATYPRAGDGEFSMGWENGAVAGQRIRVLKENTYASSYWTRSSADGRFVAHGGGQVANATVIDLAQDREIPAHAFYDPGFFPDNSGFIIQGSGGSFCRQTLLTSSPSQITFNEPECTSVPGVGLYQHLGAVRGGDYWTVHGAFASDDGGHGQTGDDPPSWFDSSSTNRLIPMIYDGARYVPRAGITVATPYEGDTVISPSSKLLISRLGSASGQHGGFSLRALDATPSGNSYTVDVPVIGRYCVRGGKPGFSYDERYIVYHHYVEANDWQALGYGSADDPAFLALRQAGAANLFLLDLTTGSERRITTMGPGQYALFPHFRSDGWIYAIVRDNNRGREDVIASDAALVFEQ